MNNAIRRLLVLGLASLTWIMASAGCSGNARIVDRIHIVTAMGFDKTDGGYSGTAFYSDFTDSGKIRVLRGSAPQIKLLMDQINRKSTKPVRIAKIRLLLFSKELAEDGLGPLFHTICKDPLLSNYMNVAIFEGSLHSLANRLADQGYDRLPYYTLEHLKAKGGFPRSNLSTLMYDYYGEGRDISLPYIRLNRSGEVEAAGFAILRDDRLQLLLNPVETLRYGILRGKPIRGNVPFSVRSGIDDGTAIFTLQFNKMSRRLAKQEDSLRVVYRLDLHGLVKEYPDELDLRKEDQMRALISQLRQQLKEQLQDLLYKLRDRRVDPLAVGDLARAHDRHWQEAAFYETEYPRIQFDVRVQVHLTKSGIGE